MNYNIKGTDIEVTAELRDYAERRLGNVEKLLQSDTGAHVDIELEFNAGEGGKKYRAEFNVMAKGKLYRAEMRGSSMHEAIDIAAAELTRELTKEKKKRLDVVRRSAAKAKEFLRGFRKNV